MKPAFRVLALASLGLALTGLLPQNVLGESWPQFLGPTRNGTSSETGLIDSIAQDSIDVVWKVPGGVGMSAVAVAGDVAVTMWNNGDQQVLAALDAATGQTCWITAIAPRYENSMGDGPRATPAIVGGVVYAYTGEGILVAAKLDSGALIWKVNAVADNGAEPSDYGMSSSPLVWQDRVIVHTGGAGSTVSAYDAKTGKQIWGAGSGAAGYSSPVLLEIGGRKQIVSFIGSGLVGLDPADGTVLWSYPFETDFHCNTATPIAIEGRIFLSAGENHGCALLDVAPQGKRYDVTEVWQSMNAKSVMRNEWQTSVVVDGYLYGFDNVGSAGPTTHLSCINADTGERVWQQPRFGKGNLTLADGKLWITTMEGELVLVRPTPTDYQELGRSRLFGKTRQSLTIAEGRGYIRDDQHVLCLRLQR